MNKSQREKIEAMHFDWAKSHAKRSIAEPMDEFQLKRLGNIPYLAGAEAMYEIMSEREAKLAELISIMVKYHRGALDKAVFTRIAALGFKVEAPND